MVVITLTDCPAALRGDLTKWLLEINTGVFVGRVSARVRENIWERVKKFSKNGKATMVFRAKNEQHLDFKVYNSEWEPIDFDGIKLMLRPSPSRTKKLSEVRLGYSKASRYQAIKRRTTQTSGVRSFPVSYVVVDLETTGLSPQGSEIIEIGALKVVEHNVVDTFSILVQSKEPIPPKIEKLTGITDFVLQKEGRELSYALSRFIDFIGKDAIIAHNAEFDKGFLHEACKKVSFDPISNRFIDTLTLSRNLALNVKRHTLKALGEYFEIEVNSAHRGLTDCFTTKVVYENLIKMI